MVNYAVKRKMPHENATWLIMLYILYKPKILKCIIIDLKRLTLVSDTPNCRTQDLFNGSA